MALEKLKLSLCDASLTTFSVMGSDFWHLYFKIHGLFIFLEKNLCFLLYDTKCHESHSRKDFYDLWSVKCFCHNPVQDILHYLQPLALRTSRVHISITFCSYFHYKSPLCPQFQFNWRCITISIVSQFRASWWWILWEIWSLILSEFLEN